MYKRLEGESHLTSASRADGQQLSTVRSTLNLANGFPLLMRKRSFCGVINAQIRNAYSLMACSIHIPACSGRFT